MYYIIILLLTFYVVGLAKQQDTVNKRIQICLKDLYRLNGIDVDKIVGKDNGKD